MWIYYVQTAVYLEKRILLQRYMQPCIKKMLNSLNVACVFFFFLNSSDTVVAIARAPCTTGRTHGEIRGFTSLPSPRYWTRLLRGRFSAYGQLGWKTMDQTICMMKCMILREDGKRAKFNRVYFYSHLKRFSWQHILPPIPASPTDKISKSIAEKKKDIKKNLLRP